MKTKTYTHNIYIHIIKYVSFCAPHHLSPRKGPGQFNSGAVVTALGPGRGSVTVVLQPSNLGSYAVDFFHRDGSTNTFHATTFTWLIRDELEDQG